MRSRFFFSTIQSGIDPNYRAILNYATTQEYALPSEPQQALQEQFIKELKEAGIWSLLDILYVFATDGDDDFACINWKSPGNFSCIQNGGPTFTTDEGFTGDGDDAYLNTQWIPNTHGVNYTANNPGMFIHINNNRQDEIVAGALQLSPSINVRLRPRNADDDIQYAIHTTTITSVENTNSIGFYHWYLDNQSASAVAKNGSVNAGAGGTGGRPTIPIYILKANVGAGLSDPGPTQYQVSVFGAGNSLVGKESALYTAWNNYFSSL